MLFTDLVGSTSLRSTLGDVVADEVRQKHDAVLAAAAVDHRGEVAKATGDGLMVVFEAAADAAACSVAMQRRIARLSGRLGVPLSIRIGLSAGDVAREGDDWFGTPVVEAARLEAAAEGDEILASEVVRVLAGTRSEVTFAPCGALDLKGLKEPLVAHVILWEALDDTPVMPFPPALSSGPFRFVGRQREEAMLSELCKRAADGQRGSVIVGGEAGVGKTRLATEIAATAHAQGAVVLAGRCDEELAVPYQPFVEVLRFFVQHAPVELLASLDGPADDLVQLAPEMRGHVALAAERPKGDPEVERYRLFEAMISWLRALSALEPVVLVLDDLHWASKPTVLLLRHLLRDREPAHLLVVGTYRTSDLPAGRPFSEMVTGLASEGVLRQLVLEGLEEVAVNDLLSDALGPSAAPIDELGRDLARRCGGNAFFATELVRAVAETGRPEAVASIPSSARAAIHDRVNRLSDAAQRVATAGAIIGLTFDLDVVAAVVEKQPSELLDALDELVAAHIVVEEDDQLGRFAFAHALVRAALTEDLSETRRAFLHRDVARAIEKTQGASLDDHLAALAQHYAAAGTADDRRRAAEFALRAGLQAAARFASEEAETLYRIGLDALGNRSEAGDRLRCELLIALADQPIHPSATRDAAHEAFRIAHGLGLAAHMAQAAALYADAGEPARPDPSAVELSNLALAALGDADPEVRSILLAALGTHHTVSEGDGPRGDEFARESIACARRVRDQPGPRAARERAYVMWELTRRSADPEFEALLYALGSRVLVLNGWSPVRERVAIVDEMKVLRDARVAGGASSLFVDEVLRLGIPVRIEMGDGEGARADLAAFHELLSGGRATPLWNFTAIATMYDGMIALVDGRFEDAQRFAETLLEMAYIGPTFGMSAGAQLWLTRREHGQLGEMRPLLEATVRVNPRISFAAVLLALTDIEEGRVADAKQRLDELTAADLANVPRDSMWSASIAYLTEAACLLHETAPAESLRRELLPFADQAIVLSWGIACLGAADRYLGMLAAASGQWEVAERNFETALDFEQALGSPALRARTQYWYARMLQQRKRAGDTERARLLLTEARATAAEIRATVLADQCLELLR